METGANEHPARLRVGVIGPGRVGIALARALARAGHEITGASAVSEVSKQRARDNFPLARLTEPAQVLADADLVLMTVPDDVLPGLVEGLAATGAPYAGRLVAHASGAYGVRVLEQASGRALVEITLHEGRNRIVRRMLAEVGHPVSRLLRVTVGPIKLGTLRPGATRDLTTKEIGELYAAVGL